MNDTPHYILCKQFEIIHAKPLRERLLGMFEMTELSRNIILNQLHKKRPDLNEIELKTELFREFYKYDFDDETINKIIEKMKLFLLTNRSNKNSSSG